MIQQATCKAPDPLVRDVLQRFRQALDLPDPSVCGPVAVAMSGGVDSSVTAAALAFFGYQVVGITLKLYSGTSSHRPGTCCAGKDIADAQKVAFGAGFSHYVLNYEQRFHASVIKPFTQSYAEGKTPLPCVLCNQTVKFSDLLSHAQTLGCAALVTGHYIQRIQTPKGPRLYRGLDPAKDQSYFLFATTREEVDYLRFPLGGLLKKETRLLADFLGLCVAEKKESQDICFVGGGRYDDFIRKTSPEAFVKGPITHIDGRHLGTHKGIAHYTIGQRRGLNLNENEPLFVVNIRPQTHEVCVGPKEALFCHALSLEKVNWLLDPCEQTSRTMSVKVRSSGACHEARALFDAKTHTALVSLIEPEAGVAPGQACVFYDDDLLLGGGWIHATHQHPIKKQEPFLCSAQPVYGHAS